MQQLEYILNGFNIILIVQVCCKLILIYKIQIKKILTSAGFGGLI